MKIETSRLLFVDQDREFLQALQKSLPRGYSIDASDSDDALQKLKSAEFDVVICNADGATTGEFQLLDWIRQHRSTTVCIALLSNPPENESPRLLEYAFDYLLKPVDLMQFAFCVGRALEYRRVLISEREARIGLERLSRQLGDRIKRATRELLNSNEHLSNANRAKDQFLAAMSHELRTPLTAITGAVRILQSPGTKEAKSRLVLEILDRNVGTLKRLLDDLLDCSRIASGKLCLELSQTSLNECVAAAVETMRSKAAEAHVEIHTLIPATTCTVDGNALRLQQIAWNLIDNAIKFTAPGGNIVVSVSESDETVELAVSDSGVGLAEEDRERIFEPFAQARESEAQRKGGLGLGLALVRNLAQLHNGTVRVESDGPGCGSRFVVRLPLAQRACPVHQAA